MGLEARTTTDAVKVTLEVFDEGVWDVRGRRFEAVEGREGKGMLGEVR